MPAPPNDLIIIKNAVGGNFDDATINAYWDDSATVYDNSRVIRTATIIELLRVRWSSATSKVDYAMNQERESLSQEAKAIGDLLNMWEKTLAEQVASDLGAGARMGVPRKVPRRRREYPHD